MKVKTEVWAQHKVKTEVWAQCDVKTEARIQHRKVNCQLVSWYFELSQPQRITSGLKTMFNLSPTSSAHK